MKDWIHFRSKFALVKWTLIKRKPLFFCRCAYRLLLNKIGFKSLRSILFHTHYRCNLSCLHCYEKKFQEQTSKSVLTVDEKISIIKKCIKMGALSIDFVSGESMLDNDLELLIKAASPWMTYITISTNGYNISKENIQKLFTSGVDKLNISFDAFDPNEHDRIRNKRGVHASALNTIELCRQIGMDFHLTTFVYKDSTKTQGFKDLVFFAVSKNIRLTFKTAIPLGNMEGKNNMLATEEDLGVLHKLHHKYPNLTRTCVPEKNSKCPGLKTICAITAYGDVLPCNSVHTSFGNLRNESLDKILVKGIKNRYFNGSYVGCPPSDDLKFIRNHLDKIFQNKNDYPPTAMEVFSDTTKNK